MAGFHSAGDWAILAAKFATRLITVEKWFSNAGVPYDFVPEVAGDAFRAVAPEHDFFCMSTTHSPTSRLSRMPRPISESSNGDMDRLTTKLSTMRPSAKSTGPSGAIHRRKEANPCIFI
jgi:hypothetical protein